MDEIIRAINHALDCAQTKMSWYTVTGDNQYMEECKEWNEIASYYMNQLIENQKCGAE
jgi:hypothetical protein